MSISTTKRAREEEEETLSTTTGKRARNEENTEDQITEVESSDLSEEHFGDGNTEVFSTLIPLMRNVCVLKICRLVCKSWNQFACRALRKHSEVFCCVDEDYPEKTESNLKLLVENAHLGLPSPFRIFMVNVTSLKEEHILRFLRYLRASTSDFLMELTIISDKVDPVELQAVLTCNQENLKIIKLELEGKIFDKDGADVFQPEVLRLPYVKTFRIFKNGLTDHWVVSLCENICLYSPLQSLTICSHSLGDGFMKVMSSLAMKSVETFYFHFHEKLSLDDWDLVRASLFKIIGIKNLSIYHFNAPTYTDPCNDKIETIISHFANSLEYLAGDYLPSLNGIYFPKLREIEGTPFDFEFYYPVERYPLLRKATFVVGSHDIFCDITDEPNLAIQEISFKTSEVTDPDSLLKVLALAGWRFPNVSYFSIENEEMQLTSAMLSAICESFPKLTELQLWINVTEDKTLSGLRGNFLEWLHEGWPLERIPRQPWTTLLDFSGLERLTLGSSVLITKYLFLYCLSKLAKLQYLTFYLNGDVSALDVRDSVGHLKRIKVVVLESLDPEDKWVDEMEGLRIMLPAVVEIDKTEEDE